MIKNAVRYISRRSRLGGKSRSLSTFPPRLLFEWYSRKLDTHPLLTKSITSGVIGGTGDLICQCISNSNEKIDWLRMGHFFLLGSFWVAPVTHTWYGALSTRFFPGSGTVERVSKRVLVDQFAFAPLFLTSFMGGLFLMEGRQNILQQLKEVVPSAIIANWSLWIPAMTINFSIVPLKYQVLFGNNVALLWTVYLSYISKHSKKYQPCKPLTEPNTRSSSVD
mmetsp:Transcript_13650/g.20787  ORF Transcript_13650/g.20787 Transcript_13650/m.20787 type:complete len:222 (-) Transcript_13650:75-740(-)